MNTLLIVSLSALSRATEAEIANAVKGAKEAYSRENQSELRRTILGRGWIWRSNEDGNGVVAVFHGDGVVEHIGMRGTWVITGPDEVTITTAGDGLYVLHFDTSWRTFECDRQEVTGTALPSAAETLCANLWSLRGDKLEFRRDGSLIQRGEGWEGKDWRLSEDGTQVTITFTNGKGGSFKFQNGRMTHFDGSPFQRIPRE
jgi:hypothetical protein